MCWPAGWTPADLFEEPGNQGAQNEWVIGFPVMKGKANVAGVPQVPFPAVQVPGCRTSVKQDHIGAALNQPAAKMNLQHQNQEVHWEIFNFQNQFLKKNLIIPFKHKPFKGAESEKDNRLSSVL